MGDALRARLGLMGCVHVGEMVMGRGEVCFRGRVGL